MQYSFFVTNQTIKVYYRHTSLVNDIYFNTHESICSCFWLHYYSVFRLILSCCMHLDYTYEHSFIIILDYCYIIKICIINVMIEKNASIFCKSISMWNHNVNVKRLAIIKLSYQIYSHLTESVIYYIKKYNSNILTTMLDIIFQKCKCSI